MLSGWPVPLCEAVQADDSPQVMFEAIDGHDYEVDGAICHVEVYGIYDDGSHRWVQLALDGDLRVMMTFELREPHGCALVSVASAQAA